jgi:hypothetical protein
VTYQGETHVVILERENDELQAQLDSSRELLKEIAEDHRRYLGKVSSDLIERARRLLDE